MHVFKLHLVIKSLHYSVRIVYLSINNFHLALTFSLVCVLF